MKFMVVVPAHNEEKHIEDVLANLEKVRQKYIVVDDGSTDSTFKLAKKQKGKVLRHKINLGKGAAMKTGAEAAFDDGADAVIFMDSDGQHQLSDLPKFVRALKEKYDFVIGIREPNMNVPLVRKYGNLVGANIIRLLFGIGTPDLLCGFRALTRKGYKKLKWNSRGYAVETEMVIRAAKYHVKYKEVPVKTVYLDKHKGVSIIDAIQILTQVIVWRFTI